MPRHSAALAAVPVLLLVLAGCVSYEQGPAGRVTDKEQRGSSVHGNGQFHLTVRPASGGEEVRFRVSEAHYHRCYRGSAYPGCTRREDRGAGVPVPSGRDVAAGEPAAPR
jgi:hypothetical protein